MRFRPSGGLGHASQKPDRDATMIAAYDAYLAEDPVLPAFNEEGTR